MSYTVLDILKASYELIGEKQPPTPRANELLNELLKAILFEENRERRRELGIPENPLG